MEKIIGIYIFELNRNFDIIDNYSGKLNVIFDIHISLMVRNFFIFLIFSILPLIALGQYTLQNKETSDNKVEADSLSDLKALENELDSLASHIDDDLMDFLKTPPSLYLDISVKNLREYSQKNLNVYNRADRKKLDSLLKAIRSYPKVAQKIYDDYAKVSSAYGKANKNLIWARPRLEKWIVEEHKNPKKAAEHSRRIDSFNLAIKQREKALDSLNNDADYPMIKFLKDKNIKIDSISHRVYREGDIISIVDSDGNHLFPAVKMDLLEYSSGIVKIRDKIDYIEETIYFDYRHKIRYFNIYEIKFMDRNLNFFDESYVAIDRPNCNNGQRAGNSIEILQPRESQIDLQRRSEILRKKYELEYLKCKIKESEMINELLLKYQ